ncbi:MAG: leucine-rich repeat protein, partial [Firmicutes bacterium]|nr:leucine-rich repeat protein [Bacillota bacterium]
MIYGSSCGDNLSWTLEDGTLTISGTGDMYNYEWGTSPWFYISNKITSVVIEDGVTFICGGAFSDCTNLTEIIVDEGNEAYCSADGVLFSKDMTTLISYPAGKTETSYDIPDGVTTLDWGAFFGCASLESVTIPDSVEWIDDWAFACCTSLSSVTIPDSVTFIRGGTFEHCESLTSITIPGSVTYISSLAFGNCQSLGEITFEGDAPYIKDNAFEGVGATAYYPYGNDTWTEDVMQDYGGSITWLTVLESGICGDEMTWTLTSDGTLTISGTGEMYDFDEETAPWYLYRESITTVVFEDGVTSIGMYAFYNCTSLESITIPESVTSIDYMAFYNCSSLTEITFKGDAPGFGDSVFGCVTATAYYPASNDTWRESVMQDYDGTITWVAYTDSGVCGDNLTWMLVDGTLTISGTGDMYDYEHIEDEDNNYGTAPWFSYFDSITSVVIEDGVTSIGSFAFFGCYNMTGITVGSSVTWIGSFAFQSCGIESIILPDSLTTIYDSAFDNCTNLTSIVIPDSVTWIGRAAFEGCTSLESITIPGSVTDINAYAFRGCASLTSVTIPASVTWIGDGIFSGCTSLTEILVDEGNTAYCSVDGVVFDANMTSLVAYPAGKTDTSYDVPDSVTSIGSFAFSYCTSLTEITFEGDAPSIGENAFECVGATAYYPADNDTWTEDVMQDYGGTITWVAYSASGTCGDNLTWTLVDGTLTISGTGEMYDYDEGTTPWQEYRESITSVVIEEGVTTIGSYAFSGMSIESITIPDGVTSIGNSVFYGCTALSSVTIPDSVEYIGEGAFSCCTSLESIIIPASVTVIAEGAFSCSDGLTEIIFEGDAPSIGDYAFDYVTATVYYPASSSTWTEDVMQDYGYGTITWVAYTAYGTCGDDLTWVLSDGVLTISGTGDMYDYEYIEDEDNNYATTPWFQYFGKVASAVIGDGVTSIGDFAFFGCYNMTEITLPDSVTSIGYNAFYDSGLTEITFEGDAPSFDNDTFYGITATAYYPADNDTWTEDVMQDYGGTITWVAYSAYGTCGDDLTWVLTSDGTIIIRGTGDMYDYDEGTAPWYEYRESITSVVVKDGVTTIGVNAFADCTSLTSVTIPDSVTSIEAYAFGNCTSLISITIPDSVTSIGWAAFESCTSLESVTIGSGVTEIGYYAFLSCTSLTEIYVDEGNTAYCSVDGILFDADMTTLVAYPAGRTDTSYVVPDGITTIGWGAFIGCASLSITVPESVTEICTDAFAYSGDLMEIIFEGDAPSIGENAFYIIIATVYYPADNGTWTADVMQSYGGEITWVAYTARGTCGDNLTWTLEDGTLTISGTGEMYDYGYETSPWYAYRYSITSAVIEDGVTSIGAWAFYYTNLTSVTIPDSVMSIGAWAFFCTNLTSITIPNSVTSIGDGVFTDCMYLESVTIGSGVTEIGDYAFQNCTSLESVTIPDSVEWIGDGIFGGCKSLTEIYVDEGNTAYCSVDGVLFDADMTKLVAYPAGRTDTSYVVPDSVTTIGFMAFSYCSLTEIIFEGDAPSIGNDAFYLVTATAYYLAENGTWTEDVMQDYGGSITWVSFTYTISDTFGDGLTWTLTGDGTLTISGEGEMPHYIFGTAPWYDNAGRITSVIIEDGVTSIGNYAFYGCTSLESVAIPDSVTSIGYMAFSGCTSVTSVNVPDSVTSIGDYAFYGCASMTSVNIPDGVTKIGSGAFSGCTSLTSVNIPDSVTSIGDYAFYGCTSLESIVIPAGVGSIGSMAFFYCTSLGEITFEGDAPSFGSNAFYGVTATAYYLANNSTWTEDVMQNYGGEITWEEYTVTYTVTFDSNGGSSVDAQSVNYGLTAAEPTDPTRVGYTFDGWYLDGEKYDFDTVVTGDVTLTAEWTLSTFTIKYHSSDSSSASSQTTKVTYGTSTAT